MNKYITNRYFLLAITIPFFLILMFYAIKVAANLQQEQAAQTEVFYNKTESIPGQIIKELQTSKHYAYLAMYTLTQQDLADALIAAKLRGLDVKIVLDYSQSLLEQEKPLISKLKKYNIDLKIPFRSTGIMHMKMLVTDEGYASGSFNWTNSASNINEEVIEIGHNQAIHDQYLKIFKQVFDENPN